MAVARTGIQVVFENIGAVPTVMGVWDASIGGGGGGVEGLGDGNYLPHAVDRGSNREWVEDAVDGLVAWTLYVAQHTGSSPTVVNQVTADGDDRKSVATGEWTVTPA